MRRWLIPLASAVPCSLPPGYDRTAWRTSRLGVSPSEALLAYFGFLNESKGADLLVEALSILHSRNVAAKLVLIGGEAGESDPTNHACAERIRDLVRRTGMTERVIWSGFASPEEVSGHLSASDVCVLPFRDGASLRRSSLLTALTHGIPVVTTQPGFPEPLLRDRENVLMVGAGEAGALADAVELLWQDRSLRERLAAGATELGSRFRWPDIAADHIRMYRAVRGAATQGEDPGRK